MAKKTDKNAVATQKAAFADIVIPPIELTTLTFDIVSDSPLIQNVFGAKAKRQMEENARMTKAEKMAKRKIGLDRRTDKIIEDMRKETLHRIDKKTIGVPAVSFKAAMITTIGALGVGVHMTNARKLMYVLPDDRHPSLLKLDCTSPEPFDAAVRVKRGGADMRYRYMIHHWGVRGLRVQFNPQIIKPEQVALLLNHAGFMNGIGDWRPGSKESNTGTYGRWHIAGKGEYKAWLAKHNIK
jgi:hypothetical protein